MVIKKILEEDGIYNFLEKRQLLSQYRKSKSNILNNINSKAYFKERKPKGSNIWYFRVNKQFRAYGSFDKTHNFRIFKISNHQNG